MPSVEAVFHSCGLICSHLNGYRQRKPIVLTWTGIFAYSSEGLSTIAAGHEFFENDGKPSLAQNRCGYLNDGFVVNIESSIRSTTSTGEQSAIALNPLRRSPAARASTAAKRVTFVI